MPADYKSHGTRNEKKPLPGFLWLLIGLALGLFVALIVYLDRQPVSEVSFADAVQAELDKLKQKKQESAKAPKQQATADDSQQPKFNFYTILPELEVLIPDSELQMGARAGDSDGGDGAKPAAGKQYLLQAGSFRSRPDAERFKAELALLGMEAGIQPVMINNDRWYRVRVGPFGNNSDAYRELNRLQKHGISAMAIELKPN